VLRRFIIFLLLCFIVPPAAWGEDEFNFAEKRIYSKRESIVMSALVPGLGQIATGHKVKGGAFLLTYVTSLVVALNSHENYRAKLEDYRESTDEYQALRFGGTYEEAEAKWRQLEEDNRELDRLHRARIAFSAAAAAVYVYNLIDALFLTSYEVPQEKRLGLAVELKGAPYLCLSVSFNSPGR